MDRDYGIYALLLNFYHLREARYIRGEYDASVLLLDFYNSLHEAKLTKRQKEILYHVFIKDMMQQEVAGKLNITQQAVSDHVNAAIRKIATLNRRKEVA
ncbi:sigma factor-like helix-turn-helix DNA-binding protein [Heliorestis convoluta]|uniref:Putative RNA polymerase subunit sigma-28 n=1 Tax=Heliorestis convoluta TaxID=356322 RepID=A0A5Q2MXX4_9FIRM|nr:sigma factor-like helix-turn-helix DNA-binding protein [Heliorestis convoluta]QGG47684.1 putative RNA polymerase subunit sigma-28 [Heliorestis convoluta]